MKSANIFLFKDMQAKLGDLNVSKIVKKCIKGKYPRIPVHFSQEMATVIKFML